MTPTDDLFWPYMLPVLEDQKTENGVVYIQMSDGNGMDRMLEASVSEDIYPGIFVLRPKYTTKRLDNYLLLSEFQVNLFVWCHGKLDDYAIQDATFNHAETIVTSIVQRLQHDERKYANFLDFNSIQIEPVIYLGADAAYGYEVKMKLGLESGELFC